MNSCVQPGVENSASVQNPAQEQFIAQLIETILDRSTEVRLTDIVVAIRQAVTHSHGKPCLPP